MIEHHVTDIYYLWKYNDFIFKLCGTTQANVRCRGHFNITEITPELSTGRLGRTQRSRYTVNDTVNDTDIFVPSLPPNNSCPARKLIMILCQKCQEL